jgi:hypothetical protein
LAGQSGATGAWICTSETKIAGPSNLVTLLATMAFNPSLKATANRRRHRPISLTTTTPELASILPRLTVRDRSTPRTKPKHRRNRPKLTRRRRRRNTSRTEVLEAVVQAEKKQRSQWRNNGRSSCATTLSLRHGRRRFFQDWMDPQLAISDFMIRRSRYL